MSEPTAVDVNDVIARYQQLLADATHRAVLAEAQLAAHLNAPLPDSDASEQ